MRRLRSFVKEKKNQIKVFAFLYRREGIHAIRRFREYMSLHREKKLSINEFIVYGDALKNDQLRDSSLFRLERNTYLQILNPDRYAALARDKFLTHLLLERNGIPMPELYAYYNPEKKGADFNTVFHDLQTKRVSSCVMKPAVDGAHGNGVFVCNGIEYGSDDCILIKSNGERISLRLFCEQNKYSSWLFEGKVVQSNQVGSINPSSVNTVRFMTALYPDGNAKVFAAWMKFGREGADVDNAGGGGNIDCAVDIESGTCFNVVQFNSFSDMIKCDRHPDSNILINGMRIENWDEIKRMSCEYQSRIPELKAIGWDVALTDDGPVIIEINNWWDPTGQLFIGKGWRDDVRDCYYAWKNYYSL